MNSDASWRRLHRIAVVAVIAATLDSVSLKILILGCVLARIFHQCIDLADSLRLMLAVAGSVAAAEGNGPSPGV